MPPIERFGASAPASSAVPPPLPPSTGADKPLNVQQMTELTISHARAAKVLKAAKWATFDAWSMAIFAGLSILLGLTSLTTLLVGVAMGAVAWNEFRGIRLVRRFETRGLSLLGWNQIGLSGVLIIYSIWRLWQALAGPNPYTEQMEAYPQAAPMLGSIAQLYTDATVGLYCGLIVLSVVVQGLTALYYFTRVKHMRSYLAETPEWAIAIQRATSI